jgi:hypothetical protein
VKAESANATTTSAKAGDSEMIYAFTCMSSYAHVAAKDQPKGADSDSVLDCGTTDHFCPEQPRFENHWSIKPEPITATNDGIFTVVEAMSTCHFLTGQARQP